MADTPERSIKGQSVNEQHYQYCNWSNCCKLHCLFKRFQSLAHCQVDQSPSYNNWKINVPLDTSVCIHIRSQVQSWLKPENWFIVQRIFFYFLNGWVYNLTSVKLTRSTWQFHWDGILGFHHLLHLPLGCLHLPYCLHSKWILLGKPTTAK